MNCDDIQKMLSRYIDGQLNEIDRRAMDSHLTDCRECQNHYQRLIKLAGMVDDFEVSGGDKYWQGQKDAILEKIEKVEAEGIAAIPRRRSRTWRQLPCRWQRLRPSR